VRERPRVERMTSQGEGRKEEMAPKGMIFCDVNKVKIYTERAFFPFIMDGTLSHFCC